MEQLLIYTRHMYFFLKILKQVVLLSKLLNLVWSVLIMMIDGYESFNDVMKFNLWNGMGFFFMNMGCIS